MSEQGWHIVVRQGLEDEYEAWLDEHADPDDEPGRNAIVIGSGPTRGHALFAAWQELDAQRTAAGKQLAELLVRPERQGA